MKSKTHFIRKTAAIILTVLAFVSTASFSGTATALAIGDDVVIVNDDGHKIVVSKSDIVKTDDSGESIEDEAALIEDDELDKIAEDSKIAAEDFNKRNNKDASSDILVEDDNGNLVNPSFDDDWSLILINKDHMIPDDYSFELTTITDDVTSDVRCAGALADMIKGAKNEGVYIYVLSPYRDLKHQTYVFDRKVDSLMEEEGYSYEEAYKKAAEIVAIPGASEHQVGLAFDFVTDHYWKLDEGFENTPAGKWLMENSVDYGFILRYPRGKEDITFIEYEPWHYRYVGVTAAKEMKELGLTLEEYDKMIGLVE